MYFRIIKISFLFVFLTYLNNSSFSQNVFISAKLDTSKILLGDQIHLNLEATFPKNVKLKMPALPDTIAEGVEIISRDKGDTVISNENIAYRQKIMITSFDSGYHEIPKLPFIISFNEVVDTLYSQPTGFDVYTIPVDTTKQEIMDIKGPYGAPITFREMLPYILGVLAVLLIAFGIYYYLKKRKKHEPLIKIAPKPKEPAHTIAFRELNELKFKKLWQQGKVKEYHSELSEIIRKYLENRFNIMAMEQTSDEILDVLKNSNYTDLSSYEILRQILMLADIVKFAKANPLPDEHDMSIKNSYLFVHQTKMEIAPAVTEEQNINESEKES